MPLQNRVTPFGDLVAVEARGLLMGNRGILHDGDRRIVRYAQGRRWIACLTSFRGRRRSVMTPRSYTELFFLDEAVALAAGHRPCAECRHVDYQRFREAWAQSVPGAASSADEIDARLHADRLLTTGTPAARRDAEHQSSGTRSSASGTRTTGPLRRTYLSTGPETPDGAFIVVDGRAWLLWDGAMLAWSPDGYRERRPRPDADVTVLTPRSIVEVMRAGYRPIVHPSAAA
jgi:hypothetical protein